MGWKVRKPRIKLAKGVYLNINKNGTSLSTKSKYVSKTTNLKTGQTKTTVRTPIKGLNYTPTSNKTKKRNKTVQKTSEVHSPTTYKICGWISLIVGIVASLIGLISFIAGGFILLIFGVPLILIGRLYIKRSAEISKEYTYLLKWQNVVIKEPSDQLITTKQQLTKISNEKAQNCIRILNDCSNILQTTTNPDTYFSRLKLMKEQINALAIISPYINLNIDTTVDMKQEIENDIPKSNNMFVDRYFSEISNDIQNLKTHQAKINRYRKAYEKLESHFCELTNDNIDFIENQYDIYTRELF